MILVNCGAQQDDVIKILEEGNDKASFKFVKKQGIKMYFESSIEDLDLAIVEAKAMIKASEVGKALYFQILKV